MKRILFIVFCSLIIVSQASADMMIIKPTLSGVGNANGGGQFTITVAGSMKVGGDTYTGEGFCGYDIGDTFGSFCVETNEYFTPGLTYFVTLNSYAIKGGVSGGSPDPLSDESAWIYTQWLDGNITHTSTNANAVQAALWYLEGENYGVNNTYVTQALAAVAAGWKNTDIMVMNLWATYLNGEYAGYSQDMLVRVPVPATILLGFLGLGIGGWKLRKSL
jgi:hypothetical protein